MPEREVHVHTIRVHYDCDECGRELTSSYRTSVGMFVHSCSCGYHVLLPDPHPYTRPYSSSCSPEPSSCSTEPSIADQLNAAGQANAGYGCINAVMMYMHCKRCGDLMGAVGESLCKRCWSIERTARAMAAAASKDN